MMNLNKRKALAAKVLGVGRNRILFSVNHLPEIKEAITKQDIRDMYAEGIIAIKPVHGRMQKEKRRTRRGPGSIKMTVRTPKRDYIHLTRKLRRHLGEIRKQGKLTQDKFIDLRKKIRAGVFKNKAHLKDYIGGKK